MQSHSHRIIKASALEQPSVQHSQNKKQRLLPHLQMIPSCASAGSREKVKTMLSGDFKMLIPQTEDLLPKHPHSSFSKVTTLIYLRHGWAKRRSRSRLQLPAFTSHTVDFPALHKQMVDGIQVSASNSESQVLAFLMRDRPTSVKPAG